MWLILAILSLAAGIYQTFYTGFGDSYQFFLIFLFAALVFVIRRRSRRKKENQ